MCQKQESQECTGKQCAKGSQKGEARACDHELFALISHSATAKSGHETAAAVQKACETVGA
eukprot:scaffold109521_cov17-Tisochrysis_lutea.AAC.1